MKHEELPKEIKERARACESPEELMALAEAEGIELSDEELDGVAGGWACASVECNAAT